MKHHLRIGRELAVWLACLALTLCYLLVGERYPWSEYLTVWPPLVWIFPLLLLGTFALVGMRRNLRQPALLIGLPILLFLAATEEWRSLGRLLYSPSKAAGDSTLELVTWNIDSAYGGKAAILGACAGADICLFQETPDGEGSFQPADLTGEWEGALWLDAGDCGILSKYPLTEMPTRSVGPWSDPQVVEVELPGGRRLLVINVRLMLPSLVLNPIGRQQYETLAKGNRQRRAQFQTLAAFVSELQKDTTAPLILCGDFNTRAGSTMLKPLYDGGLRDLWGEGGLGWGRTMIRDFPVARIDQVWAGRGVAGISGWVEAPSISDHRLVRMRIELP